MYMTGSEWNSCWGEVFRIYRLGGPGSVRVGDFVGLYYPRQIGTWLGCSGSYCAKATCPGNPTHAFGFASNEKWLQCWGEVFVIYAYGKSTGAVIKPDDQIVLYYLQQNLWLAQGPSGSTRKLPCLGTSRPPSLAKHDVCAWETFRIWKR